jgi:hypothetical protein
MPFGTRRLDGTLGATLKDETTDVQNANPAHNKKSCTGPAQINPLPRKRPDPILSFPAIELVISPPKQNPNPKKLTSKKDNTHKNLTQF